MKALKDFKQGSNRSRFVFRINPKQHGKWIEKND